MDFIRDLLTATNSSPNPEDRLSNKVRRVLEFIGFKVTDIDAQIGDGIRQEEFWVQDGDFLTITKVIDAKATRPKYKESSDLQARMTMVLRHREHVPDSENVSGLLIVNYDLANYHFRPPRLFTGDAQEIVKAAIEKRIGLLSTVELYRIAIAVKDGRLPATDGRVLIKAIINLPLP